MSNYFNNYIYGAISGSTATIVSHPFFRIKTSLQNEEILTKEMYSDIKWLYRGLPRAMLGYSIEKMLVFGTYNSLLKQDINPTLSGFFAGLTAAFSITPFEQLVIDKGNNIKIFSIKHLYSGIIPTIGRESIGFAVHFTIYDYLTKTFNREKEVPKTILCGIGAVIGGWGTITPLDRLKTQIQTGKFDIKTYNIKHSYKGFNFALMRAIPFHVTCFVVMEYLNKL